MFTCSAIWFTHFLYFCWSRTPSYMRVFLTEPQDVPPGRGKWSIFSSCTSVLLVISLVPPFFPYFLNQVHGKDISYTLFLTFALLPLASCRCSSTFHCPREDVAIVTAFAEAARQDVHQRRVFSAIQWFTWRCLLTLEYRRGWKDDKKEIGRGDGRGRAEKTSDERIKEKETNVWDAKGKT